jgi:DNA-binding response OmpR family regulator
MPETVLIIQKSENERSILSRILKELECEVQQAETVAEAIELFSEVQPDLIILSAVASGGSASEFCRYVRSNSPAQRIPIIVTSPILSGTIKLEATTKWGADEFLPLPAPLKTLVMSILFHLGRESERPDTQAAMAQAIRHRSQPAAKKQEAKKKLSPKGDLSEVSFERMAILMGARKRAGQLKIGNGEKAYVLSFTDGALVWLVSPYNDDTSLAATLVKLNLLSDQALRPFRKRMDTENELLGHMLMEAGLLKKDDIAKGLARQFSDKVLDLFGLESGSYEFSSEPLILPQDVRVVVPLGRIILDHYAQRFSLTDFEANYKDLMNASPKLIEGGPFRLTDLNLPAPTKRVIFTLNGSRSLTEFVHHSDMDPSQLMPIVHTLVKLKLIRLRQD